MLAVSLLLVSDAANGQVEKGNKEVLLFSGGFAIGVGETSGFSNFGAGGKIGYYLSRRNEVGTGTFVNVSRNRICVGRVGSDGSVSFSDCETQTSLQLGVSGFYRYNFTGRESRGFPFIGAELSVSDVTDNFTGNVRIRPFVGYKQFISKNIAIDFTAGYSAGLNRGDGSFRSVRTGVLNGEAGLSFFF